VRKLLSL
jgi:Glycosyl hydrolases family 32 N-terminal domain